MTKALRILVLAAIWVGLWGQVSWANVTFGLIIAVIDQRAQRRDHVVELDGIDERILRCMGARLD